MRFSKKLAAAVMSVGLMAGGITGVTALNDATTPTADAAYYCYAYTPIKLKPVYVTGRIKNNTCNYRVQYMNIQKGGKLLRANKASRGGTSTFNVCHANVVASAYALRV